MIEGWAPCDLCMPHVMLMHACVVPAGSSLLSLRSVASSSLLSLRSEASAQSLYWIALPDRVARTSSCGPLAHPLSGCGHSCFRRAAAVFAGFGALVRFVSERPTHAEQTRLLGELEQMTALFRE